MRYGNAPWKIGSEIRTTFIDDFDSHPAQIRSLPKNYCYNADLAECLTDTGGTLERPRIKPKFLKSFSMISSYEKFSNYDKFSPTFATLPSEDSDYYDPLMVIKETPGTSIIHEEPAFIDDEIRLFKKKHSRVRERRRDDSLKLDYSHEKSHSQLPQRYRALQSDNSIESVINDARSNKIISDESEHYHKKSIDENCAEKTREGSLRQVNGDFEELFIKSSVTKLENNPKNTNSCEKVEKSALHDEEYLNDDVFDPPENSNNELKLGDKKKITASVSIRDDKLEILDANETSPPFPPSSSNAKKSKRGSLKKLSTSSSVQMNHHDSSDYSGRSRHLEGGHRESFKKNNRTNDRSSEPDRDASDRTHKDGSLNRSLSNTDTNIEDRIGNMGEYSQLHSIDVNTNIEMERNILDGSLSDTAVGITGLDSRRTKHGPMEQRSPKSEMADRFGANSGMGKKSNSTSQLSATGNLSKILTEYSSFPLF